MKVRAVEKWRSEPETKNATLVCCSKGHGRLNGLIGEFLQDSTLHGIKYLGAPHLHIIEKIFWGIAVLICLGLSCYLVEEVYSKYNASPVIISFQPQETSVSRIPFPAITICSVNLLKSSVIRKAYQNLMDELAISQLALTEPVLRTAIIVQYITQQCLAAPSFRRIFNETMVDAKGFPDFVRFIDGEFVSNVQNTSQAQVDQLLAKNQSLFQLTDFHNAYLSCEDLVLKCIWAREAVNCRDFFFSIITKNGHCCVFNMMPSYLLRKSVAGHWVDKEKKSLPRAAMDDWESFERNGGMIRDLGGDDETTKYPKYQMSGGKPYGLSILLNPELSEYSTCTSTDGWGVKMVAHSPRSVPSVMDYGVAVPPASEVFVDIEPQLTVANKDVESIPVNKRGCLLTSDKDAQLQLFQHYTAENCMDECIAQRTYERCKCVRYFMASKISHGNDTQKLCTPKDRICAEKIRGKASQCKHCRPLCTEISYDMQLSTFPLRQNSSTFFSYKTSGGEEKRATNYSIVHIFIGTDSFYAKERKNLYGTSDLLATAGGLLSLTLGFSIISLVEIVYFSTFRAWFVFRSEGKPSKEVDEGDKIDDNGDAFYKKITGKSGKRKANITLPKTTEQEYYNWALRHRFGWTEDRHDKSTVATLSSQVEPRKL